MTTKVLPVGTHLADWSWARNVMGSLEAVGVHSGSRYLSTSFSPNITSGKCFSIAERDEGFARGFSWLLNWEVSATDALGGATAGARYGKLCYNQLRTCEYDVNPALDISVSCDTDARNSLSTVQDYFHAFQDQLHEYSEQMNVYAGSYVLNTLDWCGPHWLTVSPAWSDPNVWAAIHRGDFANPLLKNIKSYQTSSGATAAYDMDVAIKPVTVWTGLGTDTPLPITAIKDDDMPFRVFTTDNLGTHLIRGNTVTHLSGEQDAVAVKLKFPSNEADTASYLNQTDLDVLYQMFPGEQAGPRGADGVQGPVGPTGAAGAQGPAGADGAPGSTTVTSSQSGTWKTND